MKYIFSSSSEKNSYLYNFTLNGIKREGSLPWQQWAEKVKNSIIGTRKKVPENLEVKRQGRLDMYLDMEEGLQ